jgi:hypothetical protein
MNARVGARVGAEQGEPDRHRARDEQGEGDDRHRRPAVAEQPVQGQQRAEDHEDPELDHLHQLDRALGERRPDVVAQDAERDRGHEGRDQPVAAGATTATP